MIMIERIYPDFWTQSPVKMAEFSDRPMAPPPAKDQFYGFFPAKYTTAYLESYVDNHTYAGQTIRDRVFLNSRVDSVTNFQPQEPSNDNSNYKLNWIITYNKTHKIFACKLIDATGMTSQPQIPSLPGASDFQGKTLHHKSFGQQEEALLADPSAQNICILGGAKSATDVAYAFGKASKKNVHWIIREDGNGPSAFFAPPPMSARYANSNEGFYNRFVANFLPNAFGRQWGLLKWLVQGTAIGRWYAKRFWDGADKGLRGWLDYGREEGKKTGFANAEPDTP